ARQRRGRWIEVDVSCDEQIQAAIGVVVGPRGARAPSPGGDTGLSGDIGERAVAVVPNQDVAAVEGEIELRKAVVVVGADGDALAPPASADAGLLGDIAEGAVAVAVIEVRVFRSGGRGRGQC